MINVIESISDPAFLGAVPAFQSLVSWQPWLSFEKAVHGLPMDAPDLERFQRHTGRHTPRSGGYPEAVCIVGCQSGKSQIAAADGVYAAAKAMIAGQRGVFVVLIAQDTRSAQRALFGYVKEFVTASPMLQHEIVKETADTIELSGGVSIGWIGTGVMGSSMCGHLVDAGFDVAVNTRTRGKAEPLLERGAAWMDSPSYVAENSDVVRRAAEELSPGA